MFEGIAESALNLTNNLSDITEKYIGLEHVIPSVSDMFGNQAESLRRLNKELGTGSRVSSQLRKEMANLSKTTGFSLDTQLQLLNVTKNYHQSLNNVTKANLSFAKASGASVDIIGKLSAKLTILGKDSESLFNKMYESILSVRDEYGLTNEQIDDVTSTLVKYVTVMGHVNTDTAKASKNLALFTSKLTSAGVEASKVSEILDSLMDPELALDNVALLSRMGVAVNDIISGGPAEAIGNSLFGMKQLGQEIEEIAKTNRYNAQQTAKIYGLTLEEAMALANIDTSETAIQSRKNLEQFRQEVSTFGDNLKNFATILGGTLVSPLTTIGSLLEGIMNSLDTQSAAVVTAITTVIGGTILKKLITKVKDGLTNAVESAAKKFYDVKKVTELTDKLKEGTGQAAKKYSNDMSEYMSAAQERTQSKQKDIVGINNIKSPEIEPFELINPFTESKITRPIKDTKITSKNIFTDNLGKALEEVISTENKYDHDIEVLKDRVKQGLVDKNVAKDLIITLKNESERFKELQQEAINQIYTSLLNSFDDKFITLKDDYEKFKINSTSEERVDFLKENLALSLPPELMKILDEFPTLSELEPLLNNKDSLKLLEAIKENFDNRNKELVSSRETNVEEKKIKSNKISVNQEMIDFFEKEINSGEVTDYYKLETDKVELERLKNENNQLNNEIKLIQKNIDKIDIDLIDLNQKQNKINKYNKTNNKGVIKNQKELNGVLNGFKNQKTDINKTKNKFNLGAIITNGIVNLITGKTATNIPKTLSKKSDNIKEKGVTLKTAGSEIGGVEGALLRLKGFGTGILGGITGGLSKGIGFIGRLPKTLLGGIGKITKGILGGVGKILKGGSIAVLALVAGKIFEKIKESSKMQEVIAKVSNKINNLVQNVMTTIQPFVDTMINILEGPVTSIIDSVSSSFGNLIDTIGPALLNFVSSVMPAIQTIGETLVPLASNIIKFFMPVVNLISKAAVVVTNGIAKILQFVNNLFGGRSNKITGKTNSVLSYSQQTAMNTAPKDMSEYIDASNYSGEVNLDVVTEKLDNIAKHLASLGTSIDDISAAKLLELVGLNK